MSFSSVCVMGNLTRDVEIRHTNGNTAVANFTVAINRKFKTASGEQREEVAFVDCQAWGRTGETIAQFFNKGRQILVHGTIKQENWEDKNGGGKRSKLVVNVNEFAFVGPKGESGQASAPSAREEAPAIDQNDIPF